MRVRAIVLALVVAIAAGCKVDTTVHVNVREDGSGVVRVIVRADAEAVRAAESGGTPIDQAVRLADIADAGFRVGAWTRADDGSASIVVSRPFRNVSEVEGIVRALNGADGPVRALRATRDRGLLATDYGVSGRIDLDAVTTGVNDDAELLERLQALGVDVAAIDTQLLAQVRSSFDVSVVVRLPDKRPLTFSAGDVSTTANVDASAQILDTQRILLLAAAVGFLVLAIVVWVRAGRRRRRPPRRRRRPELHAPHLPRPHVPHPHVPHPHVPHPHLPRPHVPHPHLPGPPPPPPRRKPPDDVAGSE
jgi:hypothetical protein